MGVHGGVGQGGDCNLTENLGNFGCSVICILDFDVI